MSHYPQRFIVLDGDGEPLKKFRDKGNAEWFIQNKPDCTIVELEKPKKETKSEEFNRLLEQVGECLF